MIRGINQQNIFSVDEDDEKFIAILSKYHKKSEYKSGPVEEDVYSLTVLRYIHQNPRKAGLTNNIASYR